MQWEPAPNASFTTDRSWLQWPAISTQLDRAGEAVDVTLALRPDESLIFGACPMPTLTVRQSTPGDGIGAYADLFNSMGATPEQVAARTLACQNVLTTFLGEMDGQRVGFAERAAHSTPARRRAVYRVD